MSDPFKQLATALADDGILCQLQGPSQLVVSQQAGPIWPNRGNSFWVTNVNGCWFLFTWVPLGYRVPESVDVATLCRACMNSVDTAMAKVPPDLAQAFGLVELCQEDAAAVFREME